MTACPLDPAILADYWLAALPPAEEEPLELHLLACDTCAARRAQCISPCPSEQHTISPEREHAHDVQPIPYTAVDEYRNFCADCSRDCGQRTRS